MRNYKPYEARKKLKSILYWIAVVAGNQEAKKPIAYYKNRLENWTPDKIKVLEELSQVYLQEPVKRTSLGYMIFKNGELVRSELKPTKTA